MAIEDFGGEVLGQKVELVTADHRNKPDLALLVRGRRHRHRAHDLVGGARGAGAFQGKEEIDFVVGAATSAITGTACSPYGFHWAFDTHVLAVGTGVLVKTGGDIWFFLTADYAFGYALYQRDRHPCRRQGGRLGSRAAELVGLSSFLLQAELEGENRRPRQCRPNGPSGLWA